MEQCKEHSKLLRRVNYSIVLLIINILLVMQSNGDISNLVQIILRWV